MMSEHLMRIFDQISNEEEEELVDFAVSIVAEEIETSIRNVMEGVKVIYAETEEDAMIKLALVLTRDFSGTTCYYDVDLDEMHSRGVFDNIEYSYCSSVNELYYY